MKQGQFPAVLPLASLDGQIGFKLDGEMTGDRSGFSINGIGDINADGIADLIIGAPSHSNYTGRSYVIFGAANIGGSGALALSNLNGVNGFKLNGEVLYDSSGYSVSGVGDVNRDGVVDLIIGAYAHNTAIGRSYVVFGAANIGGNGLFSLSILNGTNGFKLDGEASGDYSGFSVRGAGDINKDGIADLVVGAPQQNSGGSGRSYVVFGASNIGGSGLLALSSLNGTNGFILDGEIAFDWSGNSVSGVGDINSDGIADLIIGSPAYSNNTGRTYVVFGASNVTSTGLLTLSSLKGSNGFILESEALGDHSGISVSGAGDINGDSIADLVIGAWGHNSSTGRSYVVFGNSNVGSTGLLALSSLNGVNGFKLDGEVTGDDSGISVSGVEDINGDGIVDLIIGAEGHAIVTGRSYVVFGASNIGRGGLLALSSLNGVNGFKLEGEATGDYSASSVSGVGDINGDGIADLLIGAHGHNSSAGRSYVVFGDAPPVLVNNSLSLSVGSTIQVNSTYLAAYDRNHNNNTLVFVPSAVTHGQFEIVGTPGAALANFTQQQVGSGAIQFVHDGTLVAPQYDISVYSDGIAWTGPVSAKVSFSGAPPSYFPSVIPLSSLNGQIGFKLDGENNGDYSGDSVSAVGDVNGDSYADLLIGALGHPAGSFKGRSYVVFGGPGVGSNGTLPLSSLNGVNGFKLDGENNSDYSGWPVGAAGDINGDGYADFIIGAPRYPANNRTGRSYVVFGGPGVGSNGTLALSSLNSTNGFKLDGENNDDWSSSAVSAAGDINGDGHADLLIGARDYPSGSAKGRSYVVFGGSGMGSNGTLALSSLNGTNGFKLDGENNGDYSGSSIGAAGDINDDGHVDLVIGAGGYPAGNNTGRSYVVFGGPGIGSGGALALPSLNGVNGFKLDGENNGDDSGVSVSTVGDINGDGYVDLVIGADGYLAGSLKGRSYVVFGGPGVGSNGTLPLSGLNGVNGFKLDGENNGDDSGISVSTAGDINGDGYADLVIGALSYPVGNFTGRSYVVFGGPGMGSGGALALSSLNGSNGFKLDGENNGDYSGYSVNVAGDINGDGIVDLVIGANHYPKGNSTGRTYVVFGDAPPTLVQNRLSLYPGLSVPLNSSFLSAYDRNQDNSTLVFFPTNVTHGQFESIGQPGISLANFTQPQLQSGAIQFVHDGSTVPPSYEITVHSDGIAWTGPSTANITFSRAPIILINNQLTINNGSTVLLSPSQLQATEAGFNSSLLTFLAGNIQNGYFTLTTKNTTRLTSFNQSQIDSGTVAFVHAGNALAPGYTVMATDGVQYSALSAAQVELIGAPVITQNTFTLQPSQTVIVTPSQINVTVTDTSTPSQVICQVQSVQHAAFTWVSSGLPVSNFTLAELEASEILVTQDGSAATPSYILSCSGQTGLSSVPSTPTIHFSSNGVSAPQVVDNYLLISQGGEVTLTTQNIYATQNGSQPLDNSAVFYVTDVTHGEFSITSLPGFSVTFFSQAQLQKGSVVFTHDNSMSPPGYLVAVRALGLESASLPAAVIFRPVNQPPTLMHALTDQKVIVGEPFSYAIPSDSFVDPEGEAVTLTVNRFNSSIPLPSWLSFNELNSRFTGTPPAPDFIDINVTATDPEGLSTVTDFTVTVLPEPASGTSISDVIRNAIIGAAVSGGIGLLFFGFKLWLLRRTAKYFEQATAAVESKSAEDKFHHTLIRPLAKKLLERIKMTGLLSYVSEETTQATINAMVVLVDELERQGVPLDLGQMTTVAQNALLDTIAREARSILVPRASCCSMTRFSRFFCPEVTPKQIEENVSAIAAAVKAALSLNPSSGFDTDRTLSGMELISPTGGASSSTHELPPAFLSEESKPLPSLQEQLTSSSHNIQERQMPAISSNSASVFGEKQQDHLGAPMLAAVGVNTLAGSVISTDFPI